MIRSIQGRIVLGSVAIATGVLLLLGVVVAEQLHRVAGAAVVTLAQEQLNPFVADLRNEPDEDPDLPGPGVLVLVVSPTGKVVVNTMPQGLAARVQNGGTGVERVEAGNDSYVSVGEVVVNSRGTWRLWVLRSSEAATLTEQGFARVLLLMVPLVLLLVALGSWLLVRAALRPVHRLRKAADSIQRSGTDGRLPEGRGRDELAALAATLNRFLDAQHEGIDRERRMVADASHELRTPLAVLTMQLEVGRASGGDAVVLDKAVREAQAQVRAISRLTTQLLELSQLEADSTNHRPDHATVGELVSEAMACVDRARMIAPAGVGMEFEIEGMVREDLVASMSPVAFGRIVDNLTSNAMRATTAGTVELRIEQTHDHLTVMVEDSGTGVAPEFLEHAFDRFARSRGSRAAGTEGSGLGLALVRALVRDAGGRVTLENRAVRGAIATVEVPLREGMEETGYQPPA